MKMTRLATARAKPISWVTQSMVMPSRASSTMTSSTSLIISGSSAEVGSSNSMILGFMHERAGDRDALLLAAGQLAGIFQRLLGDAARSSGSAWRSPRPRCLGILRTQIGASVRFSQHGQVREQVEVLEHHADFAADLLDVLDVVGQLDAVDDDVAASGAPPAG